MVGKVILEHAVDDINKWAVSHTSHIWRQNIRLKMCGWYELMCVRDQSADRIYLSYSRSARNWSFVVILDLFVCLSRVTHGLYDFWLKKASHFYRNEWHKYKMLNLPPFLPPSPSALPLPSAPRSIRLEQSLTSSTVMLTASWSHVWWAQLHVLKV